jgi:hypothetical protein
MTLDATIFALSDPAERGALDPRIARAEMWLCMLRLLRRIGMWLVRAIAHQIDPDKVGLTWLGPRIVFPLGFDLVTAFERVSRAVRLTGSLELKIRQDIADMRAGIFPIWAAPAPKTPRPQATPVTDLPEAGGEPTVVGDKIRDEALESIDQDIEALDETERLVGAPSEPLCEDEDFSKLLNGPLKDAVAAICADLGLKPDWSQWTEDGFPLPPDDEVTTWSVFFAPEPITTTTDDGESVGDRVWRPSWSRSRKDKRPPPCPAGAIRPSEMARSP